MPCGHLTRLSHEMKENALAQGGGEPRGVGGLPVPGAPREQQVEGVEAGLGPRLESWAGVGAAAAGKGGSALQGDEGPLIPQTLTGSGPPPEEPSGGPACSLGGTDRVGDSQPALCDPRPLPAAVVKICI